MRKQICSLALSTLFGLGVAVAAPQAAPPVQDQAAPSQNNANAPHRQIDPQRQLQVMSKRLKLTSDQQSQILPILSNRAQQMESLRSDASLSPKDRHAKMRAIRKDGDAQIRAVLNDSQKQTYDQMQQQMREREQQRREQRQNSAGGGTL